MASGPLTDVEGAIAALRAGSLAVVPTDTVYGLGGRGDDPDVAQALYRLKGRRAGHPTALLFASVEMLLDRVPALPPDVARIARDLLPSPVTLVVPNPSRAFSWLSPERPEAIGVRVPDLAGPGRTVLDALGVLVATSANLPGGVDPRRVADVPSQIIDGVAAVVDAGDLPGTPSTVIDVTGDEPRVLREGALPSREALERVRAGRHA